MTVLSPLRGRDQFRTQDRIVEREVGSGVGGHVVLSLHARVSDHVSGPRCSSLTTTSDDPGLVDGAAGG